MQKRSLRKAIHRVMNKLKVTFVNEKTKRTSRKEFSGLLADELLEIIERECGRYGCHKRVRIPSHKYCSDNCSKVVNLEKYVLGNCKECNKPFAKLAVSNKKYCHECTR